MSLANDILELQPLSELQHLLAFITHCQTASCLDDNLSLPPDKNSTYDQSMKLYSGGVLETNVAGSTQDRLAIHVTMIQVDKAPSKLSWIVIIPLELNRTYGRGHLKRVRKVRYRILTWKAPAVNSIILRISRMGAPSSLFGVHFLTSTLQIWEHAVVICVRLANPAAFGWALLSAPWWANLALWAELWDP